MLVPISRALGKIGEFFEALINATNKNSSNRMVHNLAAECVAIKNQIGKNCATTRVP